MCPQPPKKKKTNALPKTCITIIPFQAWHLAIEQLFYFEILILLQKKISLLNF
jgi:hypothetical protein